MSVHAGVWNFDGSPADTNVLLTISGLTSEYGADGERTHCNGNMAMLYRAFHTTSQSRFERQPHVCADGCIFTWDGRLDNREALLRQTDKGEDGKQSDVAIVADAFARWGTGSFAKFRGDWSLSVWIPQANELILARDYIGVRQMFFHLRRNSVVWCNHLAPLVKLGKGFHLCERYLSGFLTLWPDADLTPYEEIRSVLPGSFVRIKNAAAQSWKYWFFDRTRKFRCTSDEEYERGFHDLFRKAVARRLRTDSPVLAELSGGLDSSSIVCMADDIIKNGGAEVPALDTFSTRDSAERGDEDYLYFTAVEQKRGSRGHYVQLRGSGDELGFGDFIFTANPAFIRQDLRTARSSIVRTGNYRVVLSGIGGDEMLGQALDPRILLADLLRQMKFRDFVKQLWTWSLLLRRPWIHLLGDSALLQCPPWIRLRFSSCTRVDSWISDNFAREHNIGARQLDAAEGVWYWAPSERDSFQTILTLSRQITQMQPTIEEVRYPYLDQDLCEFLMSIPPEQLLRPGERRSLMRRALRNLLPPAILTRRTKSSGSRYFSVGLETHWDELQQMINSSLISEFGYVDRKEFANALLDAKNGKLSPFFLRLMKALFWELWLRKAIDAGVIVPKTKMAAASFRGRLKETERELPKSEH